MPPDVEPPQGSGNVYMTADISKWLLALFSGGLLLGAAGLTATVISLKQDTALEMAHAAVQDQRMAGIESKLDAILKCLEARNGKP